MFETVVTEKTSRKSAGRPSKSTTTLYFRLTKTEAEALDRWIAAQADPRPTRREAAQFLITRALGEIGPDRDGRDRG